jgi:hypothetical protein
MAEFKWAKLWCDTFEGDSFQNCFLGDDFESPILFLLLVAKCKSMGDGAGNLTIPTSRVQHILGMNFQRLRRVHGQLCVNFVGTISSTISKQSLQVSFANWALFQENRGGKKLSKPEQKGGRGKRIEERGYNNGETVFEFGETPSSNWLFEFRVSGKSKKWEELLQLAFENQTPPEILNAASKLAWLYRESVDTFRADVNEVLHAKIDKEENRRKMLTVVLKRKLGMLPDQVA